MDGNWFMNYQIWIKMKNSGPFLVKWSFKAIIFTPTYAKSSILVRFFLNFGRKPRKDRAFRKIIREPSFFRSSRFSRLSPKSCVKLQFQMISLKKSTTVCFKPCQEKFFFSVSKNRHFVCKSTSPNRLRSYKILQNHNFLTRASFSYLARSYEINLMCQ